jgi:hypothetical protein
MSIAGSHIKMDTMIALLNKGLISPVNHVVNMIRSFGEITSVQAKDIHRGKKRRNPASDKCVAVSMV